MSKLEKLNSDLFQPLAESETASVLGGAKWTYMGLTNHEGDTYHDWSTGDAEAPAESPSLVA